MKYAVVMPVKDEESYIEHALASLCGQSIKPELCVIIDDNSKDKTPEIIQSYVSAHDFIRCYKFKKTENYELGGRIVEIFNFGKQQIDQLNIDYDYIVKLDADVSFPENFFERMSQKLDGHHIGICSGTPFFVKNGHECIENNPPWHSRGQFKIYNRKCLSDIGDIPKSLGWDCADNIKAIESGWKTAAFPDLTYRIHRRVGNKYSFHKGKVRHGLGAYFLGYSFSYFFLRILLNMFSPPYISGSLFMFMGYMQGLFSHTPRILSPSQVVLLRKMLWGSVFKRMMNLALH